ncbi:HNH endonuclease [Pedobacter montanisoli]|uniref:HNH endonuclease n=1 Tax=Pedobacter montanisoli TaxID=2923277 RepID=A0ABS9ZUE6_9SPHI|nr:HNH endonuclease [Pedobacter montanisoli]MCJ0741847.1 HNH endonuclease [Pedobacter montanisoli]
MIHSINNLLYFRQKNPGIRGSGISVNDPVLLPVLSELENLKTSLENYLSDKVEKLKIEISKGQANFPSILHVSILPRNQKVSNGIYVVMCFDILGRGILVGCAESITNPKGLNTVIRKQRGIKLNIDVDGLRPTTKYNNVFENPREFYFGSIDEKQLLDHISLSLDIALYNLGLAKKDDLTIAEKADTGANDQAFDPQNLADARTKIARQITARRGQKSFRDQLLRAYEYKCAVTGCDVVSTLEACHIMPYKGDQTNHIQNGLLLRSDIHILFDLGFLTINYKNKTVILNKEITSSYYGQFKAKKIFLPKKPSDHPHLDALKFHNEHEFKQG